jgi:hypothetical protein
MARVVANKAGGWWLGTFVWGAILIAFLFGANRLGKKFGSTKPQTMCVDNTLAAVCSAPRASPRTSKGTEPLAREP